jgi:CheY-like chemotaxis protein
MKKILIVDDQEEIRRLVEATLKMSEWSVITSDSGLDAVEKARREKPDVIMMDISMPGEMDGLQATRALKTDPKTQNCSIIMLTSKGGQEDVAQGYEAGADDYFVKPFSPLALIRKVDEVMEAQT